MAKFTIKRKGYSVDEVDEFITKLLSLTESKLEEQSKRINELKEQVRSLTAEKDEFKAKECSVSGALTEAVKRADEIQSMSETRYSLELQRIKNFRKRFLDHVERIKADENIKASVLEYDEFMANLQLELETVMSEELNMEKNVLPESEKTEEQELTNGFDLQEALTPRETLEEICKELGLL